MFDRIDVNEPCRAFTTPSRLFCSLRDVRGCVRLQLQYIDLKDDGLLIDQPLSVEQDEPLGTVILAVNLKQIPVPHTGAYVWRLLWENQEIGSSKIMAYIT